MAGLHFTVTNSGNPLSLVASTADTAIQIVAPANQGVVVNSIVVSFNGITAADPPIKAELLLQTDVGSGSSAVTPVKINQSMSETLQTTAVRGPTSEPTGTTIYHGENIHMQGGVPLAIPGGKYRIKGGERLGVRVTPGTLTAATTCVVTATCEE